MAKLRGKFFPFSQRLKALQVHDFAQFRYVDADAYDPEFREIFYGPVLEVRSYASPEAPEVEDYYYNVYGVLCQDSIIRTFNHYELWSGDEI
tara:strand:+ start:10212 stop:10487 length:276 start_codon:yes stop_codon:yes gene_type:complete